MVRKKGAEKSQTSSSQKSVSSGLFRLRMDKTFWMVCSIVLAVVLLVIGFYQLFSDNEEVSPELAAQNLVDFINSQGNGEAVLVSVEREGTLYKAVIDYEGNQASLYVTLDGKQAVVSTIPLQEDLTDVSDDSVATSGVEVPKSDRPKVELFVMSHCPYGTQAEKGMLPVAKLLGDKIDFEIKFVYYAMHGEVEVKEQLNQYCIQKEQNVKYLDYLKCFLTDGDGEKCLNEVKVDKKMLESCVAKTDKQFGVMNSLANQSSWLSGRYPLFNVHQEENAKYEIAGSPTLVVNGVQASSGRDSVSLLKTICGAFNVTPEECETQLDSTTPGPGFGWDSASVSNLAACGA